MAFRINTNVQSMNALRSLSLTNDEASTMMTRLSTGLRINSGSDDPAGLQISEGFRAQLSGIDQALRNSQDATNYAKTAEGALGEVNKLLRDARSLALANSNDATLTTTQKQANANQLTSILSSVDRISTNTQFGNKRLLNGSAGVTATLTDATKVATLAIGGRIGAQDISASGGVSITVGTVAVQAKTTAVQSRDLGAIAGSGAALVGAANAGSFAINGVNFTASAGMSNNQLRDLVNARSADTGVTAQISNNAGNGAFQFTANQFGTIGNAIQVSSSSTAAMAATGTINLTSGDNAAATVTVGALSAVNFTTAAGDDGLTLKDANGNTVKLTQTGNAAGTSTVGQVLAGSAQFQIGASAGQTVNLSLASSSSSALGLGSLDIMSTASAATALAAIDTAIGTVSASRGNLGNFVRNVLESNTRALDISKESLSAADSTIRDVDVAETMTRFTQLQILQQSGMAMLAQANQAPQAVLSLLR